MYRYYVLLRWRFELLETRKSRSHSKLFQVRRVFVREPFSKIAFLRKKKLPSNIKHCVVEPPFRNLVKFSLLCTYELYKYSLQKCLLSDKTLCGRPRVSQKNRLTIKYLYKVYTYLGTVINRSVHMRMRHGHGVPMCRCTESTCRVGSGSSDTVSVSGLVTGLMYYDKLQ